MHEEVTDTDIIGELLCCINTHQNDRSKSLISVITSNNLNMPLGWLLCYSSAYNNVVIVEHLIELGAEVDYSSGGGDTPLMLAVQNHHVAIIMVLLEANANIDIVNSEGHSALQMIFDSENSSYFCHEIFHSLLVRIKSETTDIGELVDKLVKAGCALYHAAYSKDTQIMECMLERGLDVNSMSLQQKRTALHIATIMGELDLIKWLLDKGADANALDTYDSSALIVASVNGNKEIVRILLERGADPNVKNTVGLTAILAVMLVCKNVTAEESDECLELLLQYGAIPQHFKEESHQLFATNLLHLSESQVFILINHIVLRKALGEPVQNSILHYYYMGRSDLFEFEQTLENIENYVYRKKFGNSSMLEIMIDSERKMRIHARNHTLISELKRFCLIDHYKKIFPYFCKILTKRISKAVRMVNLENAAISVLCKIINSNRNEWYTPAIEVVSYLNEKDLEQLGRVYHVSL